MKVSIDGAEYVKAAPQPTGKKLSDALELRFDSDAGDDLTVRQYLTQLLLKVWNEEESFDGKRPWGNSGWQGELEAALVDAEFIGDGEDSLAYISDLILAMGKGDTK